MRHGVNAAHVLLWQCQPLCNVPCLAALAWRLAILPPSMLCMCCCSIASGSALLPASLHLPGGWPACCLQCCLYVTSFRPLAAACAGTQCVSAETKLAMLRRKMEGGSRAAIEDLRRQEQELLSLAQIEVRC